MPTTFAVLGDGGWGTAIAVLLARDPSHQVRLWSARPENGRLLQERRENIRLLPGIPIPDCIELTMDVHQAVHNADVWVSAIPTAYLRETLCRIRSELGQTAFASVVSLTKGIEIGTFRRPSEILSEILGVRRVAILSGPSHAEEVSRNLPTSVVAASSDQEFALFVQRHFHSERFRVYTNLDPIGVELAGALKNVIGIAAGGCEALGYGDNALSALITRGLVEITRFGIAHGAEASTFTGLAGVGDLITTCFSKHGRNRHVGVRLVQGDTLESIQAAMNNKIAEGVWTARAVHDRAAIMGLDMPITRIVYQIIYEGKKPADAVDDLMLRSLKTER